VELALWYKSKLMCYSKEVSLLTSSAISASSVVTGIRCHLRDWRERVDPALLSFSNNAVLGIFCIGVHQFAEYLSVATQNVWIYKAGLVASASCMYFLMRSLESLIGRRLGSRAFLWIIGALALQIALKPMTFENMHFWVRGYSHLVWSAVWMALFLYWNMSVLFVRMRMPSAVNRRLLLSYPFWVLNVSWVLSVTYAFTCTLLQHSYPAFSSFSVVGSESAMRIFQVVQDMPSIWCSFVVIQSFLIPIFLARMRHYDFKVRIPEGPLPLGRAVVAAAGLWLMMLCTWPLFFGVSLKMLTH
jgi:hypothetical protein